MTDLLVISICGFICGIDTWVELEEFGEIREDWFRTFFDLPNGIPSHDTFGRFFAAMDPEEFSRCFARSVQSISEVTDGEVVPIDGKTLRRSFDRASSKAAIHWILDVAFDEDQSRVRKDNAPENMAMLRHVALNPSRPTSW